MPLLLSVMELVRQVYWLTEDETEEGGPLTQCAVSTTNQLRTQLGSLQSSLLQSNSELSVIQSRIEVS